ncbi:MAG: AsmA-like C-terminal region-containing protein [Candidatus Omnitrophica bacterium]|nr:AsmA-like C-terminal region-containing protein [Candidatus Omnitrophota bacterium]
MTPALAFAQKSFLFDGGINFQNKSFNLKIDLGEDKWITVDVAKQTENSYQATFHIEHLTTPFFEISTVLEGTLELRSKTARTPKSLVGKIASKYTLINYKPIEELTGEFEIRDGKMHINSLSVGNLSSRGSIAMTAPYNLDLKFQLSSVDLHNFIAFFAGPQAVEAEGLVNGDIYVTESVEHPYLRGNLNSYNGSVNRIGFDSIILNAQGLYPIIAVEQSTVTNDEGLISEISGKVDLSSRDHLKQQIKSLVRTPVVTQEGGNVEWTLKRVKDNDQSSASTELKVLHKTDSSDDSSESSSGMVGVERKVEF